MIEETTTANRRGIALLCNSDGVVVRIVRDDLGVTAAQVVGRPFSSIMDEDSIDKVLNFLIQLREQETVFGWEMTLPVAGRLQSLHWAGSTVEGDHVLMIAAATGSGMMAIHEELMRAEDPQANEHHTPPMMVQAEEERRVQERDAALYDDLSRLNNQLTMMQRELAKKNAELARMNELKNQFLGMVAHDLRNPVNVIQGYAEFLNDNFEILPQERQEFLEAILRSSRFMADLISDLLDVAQIESGRLVLNRVPTDLVAMAQNNIRINGMLAAAKGIALCLHHELLPTILVDSNKIEQVFNNLIGNALKYSYRGTTVSISLTRADDDHVLITVADQGQGIPADQMDRLFRPFSTTTVRTTDGEKSTGLGLMIVRRIVEGHGGQIRVESEVGRGTTFDVTLPIDPGDIDAIVGGWGVTINGTKSYAKDHHPRPPVKWPQFSLGDGIG